MQTVHIKIVLVQGTFKEKEHLCFPTLHYLITLLAVVVMFHCALPTAVIDEIVVSFTALCTRCSLRLLHRGGDP